MTRQLHDKVKQTSPYVSWVCAEGLSVRVWYSARVAVEASNALGSTLSSVVPCHRDSSRWASHGARTIFCEVTR